MSRSPTSVTKTASHPGRRGARRGQCLVLNPPGRPIGLPVLPDHCTTAPTAWAGCVGTWNHQITAEPGSVPRDPGVASGCLVRAENREGIEAALAGEAPRASSRIADRSRGPDREQPVEQGDCPGARDQRADREEACGTSSPSSNCKIGFRSVSTSLEIRSCSVERRRTRSALPQVGSGSLWLRGAQRPAPAGLVRGRSLRPRTVAARASSV
jgi:hypothetical protein